VLPVLFVDGLEARVVLVGEAAEGRDVDDQRDAAGELAEVARLAVDVGGGLWGLKWGVLG
jgi:hypothetical protein